MRVANKLILNNALAWNSPAAADQIIKADAFSGDFFSSSLNVQSLISHVSQTTQLSSRPHSDGFLSFSLSRAA